jgi:ABC-type Fe3+-hydroxamate transport system substrate-binding protein
MSATVPTPEQEQRARKAAEAVAAYDNRLASLDAKLASIDGKLTATMWLGGIFLVMLAGSQAGLWLELGKLNGGVSQLNTQISHIESRG